MLISVLQDDIARGKRHSISADPICLAARRAGLTDPCVGATLIVFGRAERRRYATLPSCAASWARLFDNGLPVRPITFAIRGER